VDGGGVARESPPLPLPHPAIVSANAIPDSAATSVPTENAFIPESPRRQAELPPSLGPIAEREFLEHGDEKIVSRLSADGTCLITENTPI